MKPTLLILAAGMGSRYGSLKQVDQFGPSGETIIEYSIYDAIKAGFGKIVFVIKKNIEEEFKELLFKKFSDQVQVDYVLQEIDKIPKGVKVPEDRKKPWGTGQAVLLAAEKVREPFGVINADDFYGASAIKMLHDQLAAFDPKKLQACLIAYKLLNTLSDFGHVSRGVCAVNDHHNLISVTERTHIVKKQNNIFYVDEKDGQHPLTGNELVSMNLMGFSPPAFDVFAQGFSDFLADPANHSKNEFYLPSVLDAIASTEPAAVSVLQTDERWFGVTYREDKSIVEQKLRRLVKEGKYPSPLWKRHN